MVSGVVSMVVVPEGEELVELYFITWPMMGQWSANVSSSQACCFTCGMGIRVRNGHFRAFMIPVGHTESEITHQE